MQTNYLIRLLSTIALLWLATNSTTLGAPPSSSGGPDKFGYKYIDSRASGGPQYNFVDISTTGTESTAIGDDSYEGVDIGFEFTHYGQKFTSCFITSNGYIQFGSPSTVYYPTHLPDASDPNNIIAGFWTDLDPTVAGSGGIYYKLIGSAPNRQFIVQYNNVRHHNNQSESILFQVQLFETTNNIEFHYAQIGNIPYGTIGLESSAGSSGLEYIGYLAGETFSVPADLPPTPFAVRFDSPVFVEVESEFGPDKVQPRAGRNVVGYGTEQTFDAPEFVYLNRNFEELDSIGDIDDTDDSKIAYYRARNTGYAIDGELVQGADRFFEQTITEDIKIVWKWELEYAVFVEAVSESGAPLPGDGVGNPLPAVGRHWKAKDTEFSAAIDRTTGNDTLGLDISGIRFAATSYELENVRGPALGFPSDEFWKFREVTGGGAQTQPTNFGTERDGLTIAWWGKVDRRLDSKRDEVFLYLRPSTLQFTDPLFELDGEQRVQNSTTIGVRPNGQFFVEEVVPTARSPRGEIRELATLPSALVGLEWHHWAVIFDFPVADPATREIRIYRDGALVLQRTLPIPVDPSGDDVPATNPSYKPAVLQGAAQTFVWASAFYKTPAGSVLNEKLEGGLNNISMWYEALQPDSGQSPAVSRISEHARSSNGFVDGVVFSLNLDGDGTLFEAETLPFPAAARTALRGESEPVSLGNIGNRLVTETETIDNWLRVRWTLNAQVRYIVDARGGDGASGSDPFLGESFVRTYRFDDPSIVDEVLFGNESTNVFWIDVGKKTEVGSFYRTFDRCFTLKDFGEGGGPTGDLGLLGEDLSAFEDITLEDQEGNSRVARAHLVDTSGVGGTSGGARNPTEVHFAYHPTIFRAEIPLGQSFDAMNPNLQLVPALCDGAVLRTGSDGPGDAFSWAAPEIPGVSLGKPFRWDELGKRLFPVNPRSHIFEWPDAVNAGQVYKIEIVTGYPTTRVKLNSERENGDGSRVTPDQAEDDEFHEIVGSGSSRDDFLTLPGTDGKFPASPVAHYRHIFDTGDDRSPPTKLDLDTTDHWHFKEMPFSDQNAEVVVDSNSPGTKFTARGTGRSVLLYSYRPNSDEIADGTSTKENLAVRLVDSRLLSSILPINPSNPLGRYGLELGGGSVANDGAVGVVARGSTSPASIDPGPEFVLDFWLNTKNLQPDDEEITILSTGEGKLEVVLNPATSTITASYFNLTVSQPVSMEGAGWSHFVIHVFGEEFFTIPVTLLDFYADGIREEDGVVTDLLTSGNSSSFSVSSGLTPTSLKFGAGASRDSRLRLDQVRLFRGSDFVDEAADDPLTYLQPGELRNLRELRSTNLARPTLRGAGPLLYFDFERAPTAGENGAYSFANQGSVTAVGVGPKSANDITGVWAGLWALLDIQEVATRLESVLDDADFNGSGYILNQKSNYNPNIYQRDSEVGTWGAVFPVNEKRLFADALEQLEVAYYENPFRRDELSHPNVAWPYVSMAYQEVIYPTYGPHRDKKIYIASRIGSEGVDSKGKPQQVFRDERFANLSVYNQPERNLPGYNPNEEHGLVAPSYRAALRLKNLGEDIPNNPPLAAFALQNDINTTTGGASTYTSDPWVLIQVDNRETGEPEMAAYHVSKARLGELHFPRPKDEDVNATPGLAYEAAATPEDRFLTLDPEETYDFAYAFSYPIAAGDLLIPPYPLSLVIGNVAMADARGGNHSTQRTMWKDVNGHAWVVSGEGSFFYQWFYPFRGDFYPPETGTEIGTPVAWVPDLIGGVRDYVGNGPDLNPGKVVYSSFWRADYPKLKRGETLTYQGGEYFAETPGANGLPALVAMRAAEVVYDVATPSMVIRDDNVNDYSARIIRPLDRHEARFTVAQMDAAGLNPAAVTKVFIVAERWYFKDLPGSLQKRFYFDSLAEKLVFRGYLNSKDSGDPDLTSGPDPLNVLEPNVIIGDDLCRLRDVGEGTEWASAIEEIYGKTRNPTLVRDSSGMIKSPEDHYLAGMRESPMQTEVLGLNMALFDETADLEAELEKITQQVEQLRIIEKPWAIRLISSIFPPFFVEKFLGQIAEAVEFGPGWNDAHEQRISIFGYLIDELPVPSGPPLVSGESLYSHLDSFGVGSALVCNPTLLTSPVDGSRYITIAENNRSELDGAPITLHIVEIIPDRYRGAIKVIEAADAFSEKISLQHNADFGANTDDLYYEWWIRDATALDVVAEEVLDDGTLSETDSRGNSTWQQYVPERDEEVITYFQNRNPGISVETAKHLGLHSIVFEGRPDVVLADKLVLMRYRHKDETGGWSLVPFEFTNPATEWRPGIDQEGPPSVIGPAPFQWAGAANSPQPQADGSKRYIPQLVMGWVKRVLDRINPYEARYNDFFSSESPAVYSSQIQIAGAPFAGAVALNPDRNVIENTGLIELYETVLQRARNLSIDNSNPIITDGINQAILLAATRLAVLYELLAREAYSDAQDSTITVTSDDPEGLASVASFTHAFQNVEADLLHEELALLRGTDFLKSYPIYNRMIWNYFRGLGEAAYNVNYNIYDENTDGFIDENDARALFPQGHGDSWGHFLSSIGMHYELLQNPNFSWKTRSELYSLMQNVLEVDFLDEKTFAKLAAGRARTGRDIVRGTYRLNYTQDPDGQWQGYTDGADPARAWGVSEWGHRTGQAAYFDWAVANALLPEEAGDATPVNDPENLDRIERSGAVDEIGEVASGLHEIQMALDEANNGVNPLGFDSDAIAFDLDPTYLEVSSSLQGQMHFEQIYNRALTAGTNAAETLKFATSIDNKLRHIANDTDAIIAKALRQDLDYRNRLIEIFGRPYDGTIGFGKAFPEGYEGPDTLLFAYLDRTLVEEIIPPSTDPSFTSNIVFEDITSTVTGLATNTTLLEIYYDSDAEINEVGNLTTILGGSPQLTQAVQTFIGGNNYEDPTATFTMPVRRASAYSFQAPEAWGQRTSYGKVQRTLEGMLREEIALKAAIDDYKGFLGDMETLTLLLLNKIELIRETEANRAEIRDIRIGVNATFLIIETAIAGIDIGSTIAGAIANGVSEASPDAVGFSNDVGAIAQGIAAAADAAAQAPLQIAKDVEELAKAIAEFARDESIAAIEGDIGRLEFVGEVEGMMAEVEQLAGSEGPLRATIGGHLQQLEILRQEYFTAQAEGFRLLREREAFNKILAAKVQKNRYQDMLFRLSRNESMSKYQSSLDHAARYTWLAAKAYDYETSLDPGHPAAATQLFDKIVKTRQLGQWVDGQPQIGKGGLAEILAALNANYQVLESQLGINNLQVANEDISLRAELFRIGPGELQGGMAESDTRWVDALKARQVDDLWSVPEYVKHCRPFATRADGEQPGLVIRFRTTIEPGLNFFGRPLAEGDHAYSSANFATKIATAGVFLDGYANAGLATTPRAYLVPIGNDYLRVSTADEPETRMWTVHDTRIPTPFTINQSALTAPGFIPSLDGIDGQFGQSRRHGDFRMYHQPGVELGDDEESTRLIGRSIWNSEWMLVIPGAGLHADPDYGLRQFTEQVTDLKLTFKTYSQSGQ